MPLDRSGLGDLLQARLEVGGDDIQSIAALFQHGIDVLLEARDDRLDLLVGSAELLAQLSHRGRGGQRARYRAGQWEPL